MATVKNATAKRLGAAVRDGVVAIEVGPERVKYYVHKALLEEHSEYFKKALSGPWKEAEEKNVCLDDVECNTFEVFVDWLYARKLPAEHTDWVEEEYDSERSHQWHTAVQIAMMKAYAFADRMLSTDLRRAVYHKLVDNFVDDLDVPYYGTIIFAFQNLPPTSPVLEVLVDAHCRNFDETLDTKENGELELRTQLPNAFLVGVMLRYAKSKSEKEETTLERCDYHEHILETEKQECQKNHDNASDGEDGSESDSEKDPNPE
ncbi:hypothetical protein N0V95_002002 [Ascochyta clinopodiicola]|nr:hypothetical protein N0V95_002002 [Ascochyta clinopodiicola]